MRIPSLLIIVPLLASGFPGIATSAELLPRAIPYQEVTAEKMIPFRDGVIVVSEDFRAAGPITFARFDAKETMSLEVGGIERIFELARTRGGALFLGIGDRKLQLVEETTDGKLHPLQLPDELQPRFLEDLTPDIRPRLIGTDHRMAAIAADVLWWHDGTWKSRKLPVMPKFHEEHIVTPLGAGMATRHYFLDGTVLYTGWDQGEWGGVLASLDLSRENTEWTYLSGKNISDSTGILNNRPVRDIIPSGHGELWVATGGSHLASVSRGLYLRDAARKWSTLIDGESMMADDYSAPPVSDQDRGKWKFPSPSPINGITTDSRGRLHILAGQAGIFRWSGGNLEPVILHDFFNHHPKGEPPLPSSIPAAICVSAGGDIFVTTNGFGIFAFRQMGDQWTARQITLHKQSDNVPSLDRYPPSREKPASGESR